MARELFTKPVAIVFAAVEGTAGEKFKGLAVADAVYLLYQMKNIGLEPVAGNGAGAGMGRNAL